MAMVHGNPKEPILQRMIFKHQIMIECKKKKIYDSLRGKTIEKSKLDSADTLKEQNVSKKK